MKHLLHFIKTEAMLCVSLLAALISLVITPPSLSLLEKIDWKTLCTLFMLLSVLDGFKSENLFLPMIRLTDRIHSSVLLSFFLVFGVFFASMFVTNDVSIIIFVPLTILLFRKRHTEPLILPVITMENVAAIRGSLLTPFGSPQNLFLFANSGIDVGSFLLMMLPLWLGSILLISLFLLWIHQRYKAKLPDLSSPARTSQAAKTLETSRSGANGLSSANPPKRQDSPARLSFAPEGRTRRIVYIVLFVIVVLTIVTRTSLWPYVTAFVALMLLIFDRKVYGRVDYALLGTFLCFFIFSSSLAGNETIASFLKRSVAGNEYWWSIGISQIISNVPASIVLWPFTENLKALLYGLDTAGLVSVIGSLASVINMRLYTREYPGQGLEFMKIFEIYSLAFFLPVVLLQLLLL